MPPGSYKLNMNNRNRSKKEYKATAASRPPRTLVRSRARTGAFPLYGTLAFVPPVLRAEFPYNDNLNLAASTGLNTYLFNSNNMYDPNYTGTGHQPRGWDQITPYYKYYRVVSATMHVKATWNGIADSATYVGVFLDADGTVSTTTYQDMLERFGSKYHRVLKPSVLAQASLPTIRVDINKLANKALSVQRTAVGSAPDLPGPRMGVWWGRCDGSTMSYYPLLFVSIVYTCELFEPTEIGGS